MKQITVNKINLKDANTLMDAGYEVNIKQTIMSPVNKKEIYIYAADIAKYKVKHRYETPEHKLVIKACKVPHVRFERR